MWIGLHQLDQLKYGSLSKRRANEDGGKDSKSQRLISSMFMMKSEILKKSLDELEQIMEDPSQMFKVFNWLVILQEQYNDLKNKPEEMQERIYDLRVSNIDLIMGKSLEVSSDYNDTFKYLDNVNEYMNVYTKENSDKFSTHFSLKKSVFDDIFQRVKEIYDIINDPSLLEEEEEAPRTPQASSSGQPTTPGSGHTRQSPLSWSIYKKNRPSRRASPQNKWSPLNPNKISNTIVQTPSKAFDLRYFKVVLYELEEGESLEKKNYWKSVLANKEHRDHYFSPVHPHQILQANTLTVWDWSLFSIHQIATIQHFSFLLSKLYQTPEEYQDNLVRFLTRFSGDDEQINEACYFCQYCENQEPRPLTNEDKVIKYIFNNDDMNNDEKNSAKFRSFLPDRPLEWFLVDDTYNQSYVERYQTAVYEHYDLIYKIIHQTNFGEFIHSTSVKEFVEIYDFYYSDIDIESNRELVLSTLKKKLNYVDDEQPDSIQEVIERKTAEYLKAEIKSNWDLFKELSNCFI